jgi:hypothetical protein
MSDVEHLEEIEQLRAEIEFVRAERDGYKQITLDRGAEIERLYAKLVQIHSIVPAPSPLPNADYIDAMKVKWFDQLRRFLYPPPKA